SCAESCSDPASSDCSCGAYRGIAGSKRNTGANESACATAGAAEIASIASDAIALQRRVRLFADTTQPPVLKCRSTCINHERELKVPLRYQTNRSNKTARKRNKTNK